MNDTKDLIIRPIRDDPPCNGCTRSWKKPGCHDTCPDFKPWHDKKETVRKARFDYMVKRGWI